MTTIYTYDSNRVYTGSVDIDPYSAVPPGLSVTPPALTGTEVAQAAGNTWTVLPEYPKPPAPAPVYPQLTPLEMLDLFTPDEQLAIVQATMSVAAVKLWYDRMIAATYVTYEDPRTEEGLQALVGAGLLTAERKAEIVAAMQPPETA